jgi:hypothetical protein
MNSNKCKHGFDVDKNGNHIIPKNTPIGIEQVAKMWREQEKEEFPGIVDTYGYIHGTPQQREQQAAPATNKTIPKQRSTDELIEEAKKLLSKKEPDVVPKPQPKQEEQPKPKINEIKRLSRLLQDYRYNN